jgi:hypothetical protein
MGAVQFNVVSDGTGDDDNKVGPCNTLDSSSDLGLSIKSMSLNNAGGEQSSPFSSGCD